MLVFIPAIGEFVIRRRCWGAPEILMIGRVLWDRSFSSTVTGPWPPRFAVAFTGLLLVAPIAIYQHYHRKDLEGHV